MTRKVNDAFRILSNLAPRPIQLVASTFPERNLERCTHASNYVGVEFWGPGVWDGGARGAWSLLHREMCGQRKAQGRLACF